MATAAPWTAQPDPGTRAHTPEPGLTAPGRTLAAFPTLQLLVTPTCGRASTAVVGGRCVWGDALFPSQPPWAVRPGPEAHLFPGAVGPAVLSACLGVQGCRRAEGGEAEVTPGGDHSGPAAPEHLCLGCFLLPPWLPRNGPLYSPRAERPLSRGFPVSSRPNPMLCIEAEPRNRRTGWLCVQLSATDPGMEPLVHTGSRRLAPEDGRTVSHSQTTLHSRQQRTGVPASLCSLQRAKTRTPRTN